MNHHFPFKNKNVKVLKNSNNLLTYWGRRIFFLPFLFFFLFLFILEQKLFLKASMDVEKASLDLGAVQLGF